MTNDMEQFWISIANHKYACGENDFSELSDLVLSVLPLRFSNSAVEKTFSQMNTSTPSSGILFTTHIYENVQREDKVPD